MACGDGPVDAIFLAIEKITGITAVCRDFRVQAVTVGKDAQAEVNVELEHHGQLHRGRGVSTDSVEASAKAFLNAINRIAGTRLPRPSRPRQRRSFAAVVKPTQAPSLAPRGRGTARRRVPTSRVRGASRGTGSNSPDCRNTFLPTTGLLSAPLFSRCGWRAGFPGVLDLGPQAGRDVVQRGAGDAAQAVFQADRLGLRKAAAAMAGERLDPPPQVTNVGSCDSMKLAVTSMAAWITSGGLPRPSTSGKRQ